jgi:hypothetical protein
MGSDEDSEEGTHMTTTTSARYVPLGCPSSLSGDIIILFRVLMILGMYPHVSQIFLSHLVFDLVASVDSIFSLPFVEGVAVCGAPFRGLQLQYISGTR